MAAPPKPGNTTNMVGICSRLRINELQISPSSIAVARPLTSVVPCYSTLKSCGVTRGWDVHRSTASGCLAPETHPSRYSNLSERGFFFTSTMEPISSYEEKKSAVCTSLSTSCRIQPLLGAFKPKADLESQTGPFPSRSM